MPGLKRYREASLACNEGLKLDPFNVELKKASEEATQGTLKDLLTGVSPRHTPIAPCVPWSMMLP